MIKGHCLDRRRLSVNGYEKTISLTATIRWQTYPRPRATGTSSQVMVIGLGKLCYMGYEIPAYQLVWVSGMD